MNVQRERFLRRSENFENFIVRTSKFSEFFRVCKNFSIRTRVHVKRRAFFRYYKLASKLEEIEVQNVIILTFSYVLVTILFPGCSLLYSSMY